MYIAILSCQSTINEEVCAVCATTQPKSLLLKRPPISFFEDSAETLPSSPAPKQSSSSKSEPPLRDTFGITTLQTQELAWSI
jgi:hypothetical protein